MTPTQAGFYFFSGMRTTTNNRIQPIHEPVKIIRLWNRNVEELAVKMIGRQQAFPVATFEGEWKRIEWEDTP